MVLTKIVKFEGEILIREGCLSVPELTDNVKRHYWVEVEACDLKGDCFVFATEVFEAVVTQHEIDHLDGKLFIEFKRKAYR